MFWAVLTSVLPGLFWLWYFNRYDPQRESWGAIAKCVLGGAVAVFPALLWEAPFRGLLERPGSLGGHFLLSFFVVGLGEELFKFLAVYLAVARSPEFDEPVDGIIYAIAGAIGFSVVENIFYISAFGLIVAPFRGTIASLAHIAFSGLAGRSLGKARFSAQPRANLIRGVGSAVFLHGFYDFLLIAGLGSPLLIISFVLAVHYLLLRAIAKAQKAVLPS